MPPKYVCKSIKSCGKEFNDAIYSNPKSIALANSLLDECVRIRKAKGVTQKALAEKTGIKQQAISRIETKAVGTSLKTLCILLRAMNCRLKVVPKKKA